MSLKNIPFRLSYNSREDDLVKEFYVPCFQSSIRYLRAVGFFTSNSLCEVSEGLSEFVKQDGSMKLLCSPLLSASDIEAINRGYKDRPEAIADCLLREIEQIPENITASGLNVISWLIANGRLDIKIAIPEQLSGSDYGIYHEKIGIFVDGQNNTVAFFGSNNETRGGLRTNYESFDIYRSWEEAERCQQKIEHFEKLWENRGKGIEVYSFSEAASKKLLSKVQPQRCIAPARPTDTLAVLSSAKMPTEEFLDSLWEFQKEAIKKFVESSGRGILSMATGTGKTKTAIGAVLELLRHKKKLFVVVVTPQNSIARQWEAEVEVLRSFPHRIVADGTNPRWAEQLADRIHDYNGESIDVCVVFTIYNTFCSAKFTKLIAAIKDGSCVVCDEVHWAGADTFAKGLIDAYQYRLGLSATPKRHMDDDGSDFLLNYFGKVVFEFSLERALSEINPSTNETFLCPYEYFPIFVPLTAPESLEYLELTAKIKQQYARERRLAKRSPRFQRLCEQRQDVIVNAAGKFGAFKDLLEKIEEPKHMLAYCSPQQIDGVQDILNAKSIPNHKFTGEEGTTPEEEYRGRSERANILDGFENGRYSALVAMKCLDEGINILTARTGILLASTGNPRQYVQRRGRLLRRHPGKRSVSIYDLIVIPLPPKGDSAALPEDERKIIEREIVRYEEFARLATNRLQATNAIFAVKEILGFFRTRRAQ